MFSRKLKINFLLAPSFIFSCLSLFAILQMPSEVWANQAPENKDTPLQESFSGSQTEEWLVVQNKLGQLKAKVDVQTEIVESMLKERREKSTDRISQDEVEKLKAEHVKLRQINAEYNALLTDFQFRFPEKGLETKRKYIRVENQSLEQMEDNLSIDGRIKKLNKKIQSQYPSQEVTPSVDIAMDPSKIKKHKTPVGSKSPDAQSSQGSQKKDNTPDVTEKIILVK